MPVSPADFEFYSRITGQPIPRDPASRMKVAPQVYAMRRGPLSGIRERLGGAAKGALAAGALAGVGALVSQVADEERPDMGVPQEQSQISLGGVAKRDVVASDILRKVSDFTSRVSAPTTGELYGQEQVGNQTSSNVSLRSQGQVEEIASNPEPITQAEELTNSQPLEPTGIASTPEVSAATNITQQTSAQNLTDVRGRTNNLLGRVFGTTEQAATQLARYGALNSQEQEIRDLMTSYEAVEGQALAGQDQSISPFQVDGAMSSLREQNKPMRDLQKAMPGATNEQVKAAMYPSTDIGDSAIGAQSIIFPESQSVKGMSIYPNAEGEGGIGRADVIYKKVSKEDEDLPIEERGRYPYMLSAEGQKEAKRIGAGAVQTPSKASEFLTDFTKKGHLISMDPNAKKGAYGVNPSLSAIL